MCKHFSLNLCTLDLSYSTLIFHQLIELVYFCKKNLFFNQKPESYVFFSPTYYHPCFYCAHFDGLYILHSFLFSHSFWYIKCLIVRSEKRDNKWSFISMTSASERLRSSEESHLDSSKLNYTMEWNNFWRRNLIFYLCVFTLSLHFILLTWYQIWFYENLVKTLDYEF